ncbi:hypothetical protein N0V83_003419 [Neocucurbitaria cava]|uniref:C2H2-type domain-containing protein n=1 Tax=Neocucurbitaria cava TaxID=798079 RepID=A0A9W8YB40_9PLEO|nr:hypothetical protein N0V83_003419 [Neocucurbitaria cava]
MVLDYSNAPVTSTAEDGYDHWMLVQPSYGSPLSTTSSISLSEGVSTPQYTGQGPEPMYPLMEEPVPQASSNSRSSVGWGENANGACDWQQQYTENHIWDVQMPLPPWNGNDYTGLPVPPIEPCPQLVSNSTTSSFSPSMRNLYTNLPAVESARFMLEDATTAQRSNSQAVTAEEVGSQEPKAEEVSSDEDDSGSDDDCEEMDCSYGQSTYSRSSYKHKGPRKVSPVLNLGKWSMAVDPCTLPEQRHYICPFTSHPDPTGRICHQRFVRPEHLRRHVKTVHSNDREYPCKVPQCSRVFSRGDNLRDHYWTHLSRGGRAGRNDKMSLEELKVILGPKEKKLARKLKQKLHKQQKEKSWVKDPRVNK